MVRGVVIAGLSVAVLAGGPSTVAFGNEAVECIGGCGAAHDAAPVICEAGCYEPNVDRTAEPAPATHRDAGPEQPQTVLPEAQVKLEAARPAVKVIHSNLSPLRY